MQTIPVAKVKHWDKTLPLFTKGEYADGRKAPQQGITPTMILYATAPDGKKVTTGDATDWVTGVPTVTNADSLGIRPDLVGRPIASWGDLLHGDFKGKAALQDNPTIGIIDVAMAMEARGEIKYGNKGNMTKEEIDKTLKVMMDVKKSGHFRSFWTSFDQSVNLMASGEVVIQSMWSPAVAAVRSRGIACTYQPLKEGYRGWGYTLGVMKHLDGLKRDCFYEYLELVHRRLSGRVHCAPGLLLGAAGEREEVPDRRGVGLLVRRQAGRHRDPQPLRQGDGEGRHRARWRQHRPAAGQCRGVELGDGRGSLPDAQVERVHLVLTTCSPSGQRQPCHPPFDPSGV